MYYHILFDCPRLGLYKKGNEALVMEELRAGVVKQLSEMPLEMFKKYCEVREYMVDKMDHRSSIPLYNQESDSDFKEDTKD